MSITNRFIILATDPIEEKRAFTLESNNTEGNSRKINNDILDALKTLSPNILHIDNLEHFTRSIVELQAPIVLPAFYGAASFNSKALIPAICEANGIDYAGADAYTQALCNDKYVSRLYGREMGLSVSSALLVRNKGDLELSRFSRLDYPVVVKPNQGGGSNGIDGSNICQNEKEAMREAEVLILSQKVPVLIESYMPGYEVQVVIARLADGTLIVEQIGITIDGTEFHTDTLFDLKMKKLHSANVQFDCVNLISKSDLDIMVDIFNSFPKVDYMRIDCRVSKTGKARLIEFSPDCSMSKKAGCSGPSQVEVILTRKCLPNYSKAL